MVSHLIVQPSITTAGNSYYIVAGWEMSQENANSCPYLNASPKVYFLRMNPLYLFSRKERNVYIIRFSLSLITFGFCSSLIFLALSIGLLKEAQHKGFYLCYWLARKWCVCDYWSFSSAYLFIFGGEKSVLPGKKKKKNQLKLSFNITKESIA